MAKAAVAAEAAKKLLNDSRFREAKRDNDTVRLWENYREQALLWRAIALLQIPATIIALIFALYIWSNREIILNVPAKPLPGYYSASEIPDSEFLTTATEWVNLVATYQPNVAERQFRKASEMVVEPMLTLFETEMMGKELKAIKQTTRSQVYYVDPTQTQIYRDESEFVVVTMVGERLKIVSGEQLPAKITQFRVTMTTVPRNKINQYGIVITNVETASMDK